MMMMLSMMAIIIGALLGLRFKVLILVPAIVIGAVTTLGIGMAHGASVWVTLLAAILTITALQMGYLGGAVTRFVIAGVRVRKDSSGVIAVTQRSAR